LGLLTIAGTLATVVTGCGDVGGSSLTARRGRNGPVDVTLFGCRGEGDAVEGFEVGGCGESEGTAAVGVMLGFVGFKFSLDIEGVLIVLLQDTPWSGNSKPHQPEVSGIPRSMVPFFPPRIAPA
jgi:hypothetical protein